MSKKPVRVAVTGAAGQIGYSLLFRIASGEMLGKNQPVILQMLEIPDEKAQNALKGVMMELDDCAFPLLHAMVPTSDPMVAFRDAEIALLVGARPRGRAPTSSATSTSLNATMGSAVGTMPASRGKAQSSSSIMTPFRAFCAFSSGISSI